MTKREVERLESPGAKAEVQRRVEEARERQDEQDARYGPTDNQTTRQKMRGA